MRLYDAFVLFCPFFNFNILQKQKKQKNIGLEQLEI